MSTLTVPAPSFALPPGARANAPPEQRGVARDGVRLLVARPGGVAHRRFRDLPALLAPGDLVVVNTSATLPAAVDAVRPGGRVSPLHVSAPLDDGDWTVEVRRGDGRGPDRGVCAGEVVRLPGGLLLRLHTPYPDPHAATPRLWRATPSPPVAPEAYLPHHGRPITYGRGGRFGLEEHQTVFAAHPGGAEMPSAARPFTAPLVVRLVASGVAVAPLLLHACVSSPERHEPPPPERFAVPAATARLVSATRAAGGRVVAVGTTVVRALESAAGPDGEVAPAAGWTDLVLGPGRPAQVVDGLVTGLHEPEASHLLLLEAVAGAPLVATAYRHAVASGYLWHEFGDSMLFLPGPG